MAHYLLKTEPAEYSYDDLVRDGSTRWSGISAAPALLHLRTMKNGDTAFFYHTGKEKQIVGIVRMKSDPYPDPDEQNEKRIVIDIQPVKKLQNPVTLSAIKKIKELASMPLVRIGRLSVQPVSDREWSIIISLSQ